MTGSDPRPPALERTDVDDRADGGAAGVRLAVVIPVRDDAEALDRCLTALQHQTRGADDVLVVDNGSRDGSAEVAARHSARVVASRAPGIPGATATGFDSARGDVLVRLDADSLAPPDWLERINAAFTQDPTLAAVSGAARFYGGTPLVRVLGRLSLTVGYFRLIAGVIGHPPLYGSNFAIRADVWARIRESVHRDRSDVHDDLDISLQLPAGVNVRYEPDLVVEVSSRSFLRPHGARRQIGMTARTFIVASRDAGLLRQRLAWSLAPAPSSTPAGQPFPRLERCERLVAQRVWGPLSRQHRRKEPA